MFICMFMLLKVMLVISRSVYHLKSTEFCISEIYHIKSQLKKCMTFLENMDLFDKSECKSVVYLNKLNFELDFM